MLGSRVPLFPICLQIFIGGNADPGVSVKYLKILKFPVNGMDVLMPFCILLSVARLNNSVSRVLILFSAEVLMVNEILLYHLFELKGASGFSNHFAGYMRSAVKVSSGRVTLIV